MKEHNLALERQLELETKAEHRFHARRNLLPFIKYTMPEYEINWHHKVICLYLDKFLNRNLYFPGTKNLVRFLLLTAPPRHGKSEIVSRRFPAFAFGKDPNTQFIGTSYAATLAQMMNRDVQRIIDGKLYQDVFPETSLSTSNIRTSAHGAYLRNSDMFEIVDHRGIYRAAGVGGPITGMGLRLGSIDDPVKNFDEANSMVFRERNWEWYKSTFRTRLEKDALVLMTITRWHAEDLAGKVIELMKEVGANADQWMVLNFPAIMNRELPYLVPEDIRKNGEALWPNKYDKEALNKIQHTVGSYIFTALYQGNPSIIGGSLFKRKYFRYWKRDDAGNYVCMRPDKEPILINKRDLTTRAITMDPALEEKKSNDPTGMHAWGYSPKHKIWIMLDREVERIAQTEQRERAINMAFKNKCTQILIENEKLGKVLVKQSAGMDKAKDGSSIPFAECSIRGLDKIARAIPMATYQQNERVFFPMNAPWLSEFEDLILKFDGRGNAHDEDGDCMGMAEKLEGDLSVTEALSKLTGR